MRNLLTIITILLFAACGQQGSIPAAGQHVSGGFILPPASTSSNDPESVPQADRRIVRTGELHCRVVDLDAARAVVIKRLTEAGGYVAFEDLEHGRNDSTLSMRVRVPAERFDGLVVALRDIGVAGRQRYEATDVTAQWVDIEARLVAKQTMEKRYLELVARATSVAEVLTVERELGTVRAEIESMTAKRQALGEEVAMSTLTIVCSAPRATGAADDDQFAAAWRGGWNGAQRCLVGLVYAWPLLLIGACIVVWWSLARRRLVSVPASP